MDSSRSWCCILAALVSTTFLAGCSTDSAPNTGRVGLALTGQFLPGELTSLDLYIYGADAVECDEETGVLSDEPTNFVESETNVSLLEPAELSFEIPDDAAETIQTFGDACKFITEAA